MHANQIYTRPLEALEILGKRRARGLHKFIQKEAPLPKHLEEHASQPIGFCYRDITPNLEQHRFLSVCDLLGITPVMFENPHDKYTCINRAKYFMGKLVFFLELSKKFAMKTRNLKLLEFPAAEGKAMSDVVTIHGDSLIRFHREAFLLRYPQMRGKTFDVTDLAPGVAAGEIYEYLFTLAIAGGVLIENFSLEGEEANFTRNVVMPAFEKIKGRFGERPLVVPLEPTELEGDDFWYFYPGDIELVVKNLIESEHARTL